MTLMHPTDVVVVAAPPVFPPVPVAVATAKAAEIKADHAQKIAGLKRTATQQWAGGKAERVKIGHTLSLLQEELANPGHGTFIQAVREIGIPLATAYAYIAEFKGKKRPSTTRKDELVRISRKVAKAQLAPFRDKEDELVVLVQKVLQATADSLLGYAGSGLTVIVEVNK